VLGKFRRSPHVDARALARSRPSPVRARINSRSNSAKPAKHGEHQPPVRGRRVRHASPSERKPAPFSAICASVLRRSRVERARRSRRVTRSVSPSSRARNRSRQFPPLGLGSAGRLPKHLLGSGGAKLLHLSVDALAVRRDSRVAVNHRFISAPDIRHGKALKTQGAGFGT